MVTESHRICAGGFFAALFLIYLSIVGGMATANATQRNPAPAKNSQPTVNIASIPSWTNITTSSGPSRRELAPMAYDSADGYVVLFGGASTVYPPGYEVLLGDTWKFSGGSWSNITSTSGPNPSARLGAAMAYDVADGYIVLFGGQNGRVPPFDDTWKFAAGSWSNITSTVGASPPALAAGALAAGPMVYDSADHYTVLFDEGSTWKFSNGLWTLISTNGPSPRIDTSMTFDGSDNYVVLNGGYQYPSDAILSDTWKFSGGTWTNITSTIYFPRGAAGMTYDVADGYTLLFGGASKIVEDDSWKFLAGSWTNITGAVSPPARFSPSMAYDAYDGYVLLFGGVGSYRCLLGPCETLSDTWTFPSTQPPPLLAASASANPITGAPPLTVQFTGSASGGTTPYSYSWSFGDGSAGASYQNPTHQYIQAGTYTAVLTVTDYYPHTTNSRIIITVKLPSNNVATPNIFGLDPTIFYALIGILAVVVVVVVAEILERFRKNSNRSKQTRMEQF